MKLRSIITSITLTLLVVIPGAIAWDWIVVVPKQHEAALREVEEYRRKFSIPRVVSEVDGCQIYAYVYRGRTLNFMKCE